MKPYREKLLKKMDELNKQLWEIITNQKKIFMNDFTSLKVNFSFDLFDEVPVYKNLSGWEELQSLFRFHYNRSLYAHKHQQKLIEQDCHPFGDIFEVIQFYYLPFMIFLGLVGNLLSCIVFLNTHLKMKSCSYYLAALACADFGFLASLFLVWLNGTLEISVFNIQGYCQCIVYISSVCCFLSVWLITAFTVERFIAVQYPLHRPHVCTVSRAKAIVLYLVCFSLAAHTYVFITSGIIRQEDGSEICGMLEGHRQAMWVINIIDCILTLIVPLVLIIVMNFMIINNLIKFTKRFKKPEHEFATLKDRKLDVISMAINSSTRPSTVGSRKNLFQASNSSKIDSSFRNFAQFKASTKKDKPKKLDAKKFTIMDSSRKIFSTRSQQSITKMLLLISSVFVLLNLPSFHGTKTFSYVMRLYVFIFFSIWAESPPVLLWCFQQLFMILFYTNFSINFLLYSMCGTTFRRCLWQLFRKKFKKMSTYQFQKVTGIKKIFHSNLKPHF